MIRLPAPPVIACPTDQDFDPAAYRAARDLVFKGLEQPSGYTEPLLHAWRLKVKEKQ